MSARILLPTALLAFGAYLVLGAMLSDVYPFSHFTMYSGVTAQASSRIVARDLQGGVHEVLRYRAWSCDGPTNEEAATCADHGSFYRVLYLDDRMLRWVQDHAVRPDESVNLTEELQLVRRIWHLRDGPPEIEDCVIASCRVRR